MDRSDSIVAWLVKHEAINLSALARLTKYDVTNMAKAMAGQRKIPEKYLPSFERILKEYGYEPNRN